MQGNIQLLPFLVHLKSIQTHSSCSLDLVARLMNTALELDHKASEACRPSSQLCNCLVSPTAQSSVVSILSGSTSQVIDVRSH